MQTQTGHFNCGIVTQEMYSHLILVLLANEEIKGLIDIQFISFENKQRIAKFSIFFFGIKFSKVNKN